MVLDRLLIPVAACVLLATVSFMVAWMFLDLPAAVVCEREPSRYMDIAVSTPRKHGYFEEHRIGPCVAIMYNSNAPNVAGSDPWGD